jgi:hypothetical protein
MDYVIFKESGHYRRGREPGETARILSEGLLATGFPPERVVTFADEQEAITHVIGRMEPGSVVAVIADAPNVVDQFRSL